MSKRQIFIIVFSVVLITAVIILGVSLRFKGEKPDSGIPLVEDAEGDGVGAEEPGGIPEFSKEVDERAEETEPRKAVEIEKGGEKTGAKLGIYEIVASPAGFSPSEIVVIKGDAVKIEFSVEDEKLDFYIPAYGTYLVASPGEKRDISFDASASGTFRIECRDFCPRSGVIYGQLIVKPKE